ncbi:MAG: NAD(P)-dependent oxidoreductase [Chloroflexota bacterium]|nr:NAD(P)-dependent oxidoreductase [Chloroflexota bacterium]MDE2947763.1 NAD(P)-dependent oxidoreductase [Chloroflexota bacterium]
MQILVTGATGRIGANLVTRLLDAGHTIRSFVFPADASRARKLDAYDGVETVFGDLRKADDVGDAVAGVDAIYHLAAAFQGPFDNRQYLDINAMGTLNILESIRERNPNLHRLVYASTEGVYLDARVNGRYSPAPNREDRRITYPAMGYLMTKWLGEELAMVYHYQYGLPACVMRFSTVIEPSEFLNEAGLPSMFLYSETYANYSDPNAYHLQNMPDKDDPDVQAMIEALRAGWDGHEKLLLSLNPDGVPYRQRFGDVRDIADGLTLALENDAAVGEIFNLSGAALFDWGEIVPMLAERYNMPYVEARIPFINFIDHDLSKIKTKLGFQPRHDFDSVLATAEAIRRGESTDVIPTGVMFGEA